MLNLNYLYILNTDSTFLRDTEWLMKSFEEGYREQTVIVTAPNVLDPKYIRKIALINQAITNFELQLHNGSVANWNDVCFKIPIIAPYVNNRKRRDIDNTYVNETIRPFNPSVDLPSMIFCNILNSLPLGCLQNNLAELWKYDLDMINNLTVNDVINVLNTTRLSPVTGHKVDFMPLLGNIERNSSTGAIISAGSIRSTWYVHVNFSDVDHEKIGNMAGTEDWASELILLWEGEFLKVMERVKTELEDDQFNIYYSAGRSYGDISASTMFQDMDKVFIGAFIMFVFMQIVLSKFSCIELRISLASLGLLSIGMAFASCVGFCSVLGVPYGPVHTSLPFLLMGLGVDDMFIMMASWRQIPASKNNLPIEQRLGLMLKHAGVSITVTSVTDIVAFLVGASTILPSLQSFCIYAAVGIFFTYLLAITFFVAVFALDEQRIVARRNSIIPCIKHKSVGRQLMVQENKLNLMQRCLKVIYSKVILTTPGKVRL